MVAQHLRHEGDQLGERGDVRYPPGRDVLGPADHAAWQSGAQVEVQDEGVVGAQFEPARVGGWARRGPRNVLLLLHAPDGTRRGIHAPWNRGSIGVRRRLENGSA